MFCLHSCFQAKSLVFSVAEILLVFDHVRNRDPIIPTNPPPPKKKHSFQSEELVRLLVCKHLSCPFCKGCFSYGLPKPIISFIKVLTKQINFNIWCKGRTHVCAETAILTNIL